MKKWLALLLALALIGAVGASAESLKAKQRYNLNLFLSNFTEQGFCWREGEYFDIDDFDTAMMTEFAVDHCWFNRQNRLEWGDYFNGNNVRLPESQIEPIVKKYFGVSISPNHYLNYIDYKNGYYYWEETGGHTNDGFACLYDYENLGNGYFRVYFDVFGAGERWDNDVCYYTTSQARKAYPPYGDTTSGYAVINTGKTGLNDRSGWSLDTYALYH